MPKNRAIIVITVIVAIVLIALAVFYFFFMGQAPTTPTNNVFPVGPDLPFGTGGDSTGGTGTDIGGATGGGTTGGGTGYINRPKTFTQEKLKLRLISSLPVSGATLFDKNAETFVRYVERQDGNIFETISSEDKPPYRISNTTIPKIYEAYWVQNGQGVILRYLKNEDIQTFYTALKSGATSTELTLADGTFLPNNIDSLAVSPAQDKIFYIIKRDDGAVGIRANPNNSQRTQAFYSSAREWLTSWNRARTILLSTKPSASVPGLLYILDTNNNSIRKTLGGVNGLTALQSPDGKFVLFSESVGSKITLKLLDAEASRITEIGVNTLPEKCVWGKTDVTILYCAVPDTIPSGEYPDAWYQGTISFSDNLWKINTKTGQTEMILTPQSVAKTTMDITNLILSDKEDYLLFTNKKDLSLWLLSLGETIR